MYKFASLLGATLAQQYIEQINQPSQGLSKEIPTVTLNNGVEMPAVAAGTWKYNLTQVDNEISNAISVGWNHFDTAHDYCEDGSSGLKCKGSSVQTAVGQAIRDSSLNRDQVFITTKVPGCGLQGVRREHCAADTLKIHQKNLDELEVDQVDLLLVHFPPPGGCGPLNCRVIKDQWKAFQELYEQNKTRAIGVSNFCQQCIECLSSGNKTGDVMMPAVNQFQFHVGMGNDPQGLISYCQEKGIQVEAYSPLGSNTTELITGDLVTAIGEAHNVTGVQVALRWIYQQGIILTTKASSTQHLAEDIDVFSWSLTDDEMATLSAATTPAGSPSLMMKCSSKTFREEMEGFLNLEE